MKEKILVVIPCYNEEKNISNVIDDIQNHIKSADIVVINDCSTDKTEEIVTKKGIVCLKPPFNLKYAKAVQTGIKYAYENDYDYVVQFDGDGQHLASEVIKMLDIIQKNKSDIVIGSRFLEKTDYPHPFFRKIGTRAFSVIIKILTKKVLADPTSGFQILNKKVIKRYAINYPEYPDANLIIEMLYEGYIIDEISVLMKESNTGQSMHGGIIKPIKYMIKVFYTIIIIFIRNIFRKR